MFKRIIFLVIVLLSLPQVKAQKKNQRKTIKTTRTNNAPKIDGLLNDKVWKNSEVITDFVIFRPANGELVSSKYQTTVRVLYDDDAIYISGQMNDPDHRKYSERICSKR